MIDVRLIKLYNTVLDSVRLYLTVIGVRFYKTVLNSDRCTSVYDCIRQC